MRHRYPIVCWNNPCNQLCVQAIFRSKLYGFNLLSEINTPPRGKFQKGKCICQTERMRTIRLALTTRLKLSASWVVFKREFACSPIEKAERYTLRLVCVDTCLYVCEKRICQSERMRKLSLRKGRSVRLDEKKSALLGES